MVGDLSEHEVVVLHIIVVAPVDCHVKLKSDICCGGQIAQ